MEKTNIVIMERHFIGEDLICMNLEMEHKNNVIIKATYRAKKNGKVIDEKECKAYAGHDVEECKRFLIEKCGCHEIKEEE